VDTEARAQRAAQILDAARERFFAKGFHGASINEIAQAAGVSIANLYQYFASKDDLIVALIEADLESDLDLLRQMDEAPDPVAALGALARHLRQAVHAPGYARLRLDILAEGARNPRVAAALATAEAKSQAAMTRLVRAAQDNGRLPKHIAPDALAALFLEITDGHFARMLLDLPQADAALDAFEALFGNTSTPQSS
jgi:AcrR family transcriptional regulator